MSSSSSSPPPPVLLLLLLILPLVVNARIFGVPTIGMDVSINGSSISYFARLRLNLSAADINAEDRFLIDTNARFVSFSSNSCAVGKPREIGIWSLVTGDSGTTASAADTFLANVAALCHPKNIAGLSPAATALPAQLSKLGQIPLRFAYVLGATGGQLLFGKTVWLQYIGFAPERTIPVSFVQIPLTTATSATAASYRVKLTGIGFQSVSSTTGTVVQISTTQRFTTLPGKIYSSLVTQFHKEASQRKIQSAATSFGELRQCYRMKSSDLASFHNLTMVFEGNARWSVPGDKYLVPKTGDSGVFCLAFLEAAAGSSGVVIGTLPQEGRAIDYNLEKKSLGVSLPLVGALFSP